ncbi:MAG: VWA domain-containing protein [Planctomycetaceae bacterium]|jgi:hypothetical protein|nr:VWA domain-containing protein [Planctomycetaceae bacterium]
MQIPVPLPRQPVSVPLPQKEGNERQKYAVIAGIVLLLLLILLLFWLMSKPAGTDSSGAQTGGADKNAAADSGHTDSDQPPSGNTVSGHTPPVPETAPATNSEPAAEPAAESAAETKQTAESPPSAEPAPPKGQADTEKNTPPVSDSVNDLIRNLNGDAADYSDETPPEKQNQNGGGTIGKGDATVQFFGTVGKGSKFVFVFDRSGSMAGQPLEALKRQLIQCLEPLKSNHSLNLICYDDRFDPWKNQLVKATPENKKEAIRFIDNTVSRGGTEPRDALLKAIENKPEIIFFMTDGSFSLNLEEICGAAKKGKIKINCVQFTSGKIPLSVLQDLAKRTGGDFMLVDIQKLDSL